MIIEAPDAPALTARPASAASAALGDSLVAYWSSIAQFAGGAAERADGLSWTDTGTEVFNRIIGSGPGEAAEPLDVALRRFNARGASVSWLVLPESGSRAAETLPTARLAQRGFERAHKGTAMAIDLSIAPLRGATAPAVRIRRVGDEETHRHWLSVVDEAFRLPVAARHVLDRVPVEAHDGSSGQPAVSWQRFVAYRGDRPVSTATLVCTDLTAGIYLVGTRADAARQGLATALVLHALRLARAAGYPLVVLEATDQARTVYRRIGFTEFGPVTTYRRAPSRSSLVARLRGLARRVRSATVPRQRIVIGTRTFGRPSTVPKSA